MPRLTDIPLRNRVMKAPGDPAPAPLTDLLHAWSDGDRDAGEEIFATLYGELRRLAGVRLRRERPGHTLRPTALVHEAYLRLVGQRRVHWHSRGHFLALAGRMMRRILVDHERRRRREKRGGGAIRIEIDDAVIGTGRRSTDLLALSEALDRLGTFDRRKAQVVEIHFFGGLSVVETAAVLGCSTATVVRDWRMARAWLFRELRRGAGRGA